MTIDSLLDSFESTALDDMDSIAALRVRYDRKYLCTVSEAIRAITSTDEHWKALEIDGRRAFRYRSLYFDTPELDSFYGSARRRRRRFKVRRRSYDESHPSVLEVKTRGPHGRTVKTRLDIEPPTSDTLQSGEISFIEETLGAPGIGSLLRPAMWTSYRRFTLTDESTASRLSVDQDVGFAQPNEPFRQLTASIVLETKTTGSPTSVDRALWSLGVRPVAFSKFAVSCVAADDSLPSNRWHRVIRQHVDLSQRR